MGGARLSGVHNSRQFLDSALAPEVMFLSPQWLKPDHFRILTAPLPPQHAQRRRVLGTPALKRCSTLHQR